MTAKKRLPVLSIQDLIIKFRSEEEYITAVDNITMEIFPGETVGVVGESGSGKTVTALSILNLIPNPPGEIIQGEIYFRSKQAGTINLAQLPESEIRKIRGNEISMIFQEPMTSLNPVINCGNQIIESLVKHKGISRRDAIRKTIGLFEKVRLPRPEIILKTYPHQLSGGEKQRVMIAMALATEPQLIIADEPSTALDVTTQASILTLIKNLREDFNSSVLFITHDLGVIADVADRVLVMYKGRIVEQGTVWDVYSDPKHPYTKGLLACRPRLDIRLKVLPTVTDFMAGNENHREGVKYSSVGEALLLNVERRDEMIERRIKVVKGGAILKVRDLKKYFSSRKNIFSSQMEVVKAVDGVSFDVYPGETIGLVGESGSGKTTLGRLIIRLTDPTAGRIDFEGRDLALLKAPEIRELRKSMQIIFQDPYSSLDPRQMIGEAILEPMKIHHLYGKHSSQKNRVFELLNKVGLDEKSYNRYPHEFSGGQRQRICIARALAVEPRFLILDESVSALDVSVQAQVLNLLNQLKQDFNFTYIFISHDLSIVKFMSDRIFIMRNGQFIEMGFPEDLYLKPRDPYTRKLIEAIPKGDLEDIRKNILQKRMAVAIRDIRTEEKMKYE
ncbi:MAG: ABC transporter ATP-binding protein [Cyclobacteriaceae bacterium]|nr:ABC transporter ATP-binding protein [Cyclobacteriaceae bacterium]